MRDHLSAGLAWLAQGAERPDAPEKSTSAEIRESHEVNDGEISAARAHSLAAEAAPALAGGDPIVPPADQIVRALGPTALQLEGKDGKPGGAVIADIPLAVPAPDSEDGGDWQPADLRFKAQGSRLVVKSALVPTSVPEAAGGTFRVGDLGVKLAPAGSDSTATSYSTDVVYPNIDGDTDLITRSVGSGIRYGWLLRGSGASQVQRAKLDLPSGASAKLGEDGSVRILGADGEVLGDVSPAAATDADGISVPIETTLDGDTISYRLMTDLAKVKAPVIIDPQMESKWSTGDTNTDSWAWARSSSAVPFTMTMPVTDPDLNKRGLRVDGTAGTAGYAANAWGGWTRWAPGDQNVGTTNPLNNTQKVSPEHGFYWKAEFGGLNYNVEVANAFAAQDPNVNIGMLSSNDVNHPTPQRSNLMNASGGWNAPMGNNLRLIPSGTTGATYRVYVGTNPDAPPATGKPDSVFSATLYDFGYYGTGARPASHLRIGWTKLFAADNVAPTVDSVTPNTIGTTGWMGLTSTITTTATDRGTGIEKLEIYDQANTTLYSPGVAPTCPLTGQTLCPFTFNGPVGVAPVPEGIGNYTMRVTDAGGRIGTKPLALKIDKTAPEMTLSGALFSQRDTPLSQGEVRDLTVMAADGVDGGAADQRRSGVQRIDVYVNEVLASTTEQTQTGDSKPLTTTWTPPANTFRAGGYIVRVVATDAVGHEKEAQFLVKKSCEDVSTGPDDAPEYYEDAETERGLVCGPDAEETNPADEQDEYDLSPESGLLNESAAEPDPSSPDDGGLLRAGPVYDMPFIQYVDYPHISKNGTDVSAHAWWKALDNRLLGDTGYTRAWLYQWSGTHWVFLDTDARWLREKRFERVRVNVRHRCVKHGSRKYLYRAVADVDIIGKPDTAKKSVTMNWVGCTAIGA